MRSDMDLQMVFPDYSQEPYSIGVNNEPRNEANKKQLNLSLRRFFTDVLITLVRNLGQVSSFLHADLHQINVADVQKH